MGDGALAIDLGSSSVRAIVFESSGAPEGSETSLAARPGAMARRLRHLSTTKPGQATFSAASYLDDLVACIDELHSQGSLDGVRAVATDSQWHSVVAVGADGTASSEVISWADTQAGEARAGRGPGTERGSHDWEDLRQRTGCAYAAMYWPRKLPWLRQCLGQPLPDWARFVGLAEYVGLHLLGDPSMSVSMASATGMLETASQSWDAEALDLAATQEKELPPIAPAGWRGRLQGEWARRWPELAGVDWWPCLGDGAAANLGVGCDTPKRAALTVGTSAAARAVRPRASAQARLAASLWRYCVDSERFVLGAAYSSGGQLYSWALSLWEGASTAPTGATGGAAGAAGGVSHEVRYDLAMPVGAGSDGVIVLPWHAGARPPATPVGSGRGCVLGLGLGHGGAHITSAAVEAVCFQLADGLAALEEAAGDDLVPVVNGGAIERAPWWQERLASCLGREVFVTDVPETTARGAAAQALGVDLAGAAPPGRRVEPVGQDIGPLAEARQRWREYYSELVPIVAPASASAEA